MTKREMLTIGAAAKVLNVSVAYAKGLASASRFEGVVTLANGHLRIPSSEVTRVHEAMKATTRRALKRTAKLDAPQRALELENARTRAAKRRSVKSGGKSERTGLAAAEVRGKAALARWVADGVLVKGDVFARARGVSRQSLGAAVRRKELFSLDVKGRRYYLAALLEVESERAASVCRALAGATDSEKVIFWLRQHGALGGKTVTAAIGAGRLARVLTLAETHAEEGGWRPASAIHSGPSRA